MDRKERTKRDEQKAKARGLKKIHPLVPVDKAKDVLDFCKALRDTHKKEAEL